MSADIDTGLLHKDAGAASYVEPKIPTMGANMRICFHCLTAYDWRKSTSRSLKMTFCGTMCEIAENGHTIEDLMYAQRSPSRLLRELAGVS